MSPCNGRRKKSAGSEPGPFSSHDSCVYHHLSFPFVPLASSSLGAAPILTHSLTSYSGNLYTGLLNSAACLFVTEHGCAFHPPPCTVSYSIATAFLVMFRRYTLPLGTTAMFGAFSMSTRLAHHKPTTHDWSHILPRNMSSEAHAALQSQSHRTVSAVVPGKMFMRHWIAAEQSTVSVVERALTGMVAVFTMLWAACYATLGYNGHNSAHVAGWMFIAYWLVLYTHAMWLAPTFLALAMLELILN